MRWPQRPATTSPQPTPTATGSSAATPPAGTSAELACAAAGDFEALADLQREQDSSRAFSIYLRARAHHEAIVTLTEEGDLVLGLGIDDPLNDPSVGVQAEHLMADLKTEFQAMAAVGGVELPPPQSASEWTEEGLAMLRAGDL